MKWYRFRTIEVIILFDVEGWGQAESKDMGNNFHRKVHNGVVPIVQFLEKCMIWIRTSSFFVGIWVVL